MTDLHVHTNFCDGHDSPEEMVLSAISKGLKKLGIVTHSYVPFDPESCISIDRIEDFVYEISVLKKKYQDRIELLCGVEMDIFSTHDTTLFDYVIGSVHYLKQDGRYISVDETPTMLLDMIKKHYSGDFYACAEDYFDTVAQWAERSPDIIGHFDLIKKFSLFARFDPENERYRAAWQKAADALLKLGVPFEINTGGIAKGWLREPYPSDEMIDYILSHGGSVILSSDAHRKEKIAFGFEYLNQKL